MSNWQRTILALVFLAIVQATSAVAQTVFVLGYAAAKNVNPKRLDVFNKDADALLWRRCWSVDRTDLSDLDLGL
jgi:hypothetical protein